MYVLNRNFEHPVGEGGGEEGEISGLSIAIANSDHFEDARVIGILAGSILLANSFISRAGDRTQGELPQDLNNLILDVIAIMGISKVYPCPDPGIILTQLHMLLVRRHSVSLVCM